MKKLELTLSELNYVITALDLFEHRTREGIFKKFPSLLSARDKAIKALTD